MPPVVPAAQASCAVGSLGADLPEPRRVPTASALVRGRLLGPEPRLEERGAEMVRDAVDQVFQLREGCQISRGRSRDRGRDRGTGLERRGGPLRIAEIAIP